MFRTSSLVLGIVGSLILLAMLAACATTTSQAPCKVWGPMGQCIEREALPDGGAGSPATPPPATTGPECQPAK
jgi:hypothetical protein